MATTSACGKHMITLIGIVGPPGSGKGTQCELLARRYRLEHLSIGDILRAQIGRDEESPQAAIIKENMALGRIGPPEITIGALRNRIDEAMANGTTTFALDGKCITTTHVATLMIILTGFPRNVQQCEYLESQITKLSQVVVFDCADDVIKDRLAARGRWDDLEVENVNRRLDTFHDVTSQILAVFEASNQLVHINAAQDVDQVAAELREVLKGALQHVPLRSGHSNAEEVQK